MVVCSWDVGITHLAYCVINRRDDDENPYEILEWENINLMKDDDIRNLKCACHNKKGNVCGKKAKYIIKNIVDYMHFKKDTYFGYCEIHKEFSREIESLNNDFLKEFDLPDNKGSCEHIIKGRKDTCDKSSKYLTHCGKYYCAPHYSTYSKNLQKEYIVMPLNKSRLRITKSSTKILQENLINILDEKKHLLQVDEVIIENQPALKNPTMKTIASTIFNYFLIRGIIDKDINDSKVQNLQFICPSNKLKIDNDNTVKMLSKTSDGKKYKITKELGIKYCKRLLKNEPEKLAYLEKFKKKDDLCDAFLQGVYYLDFYKKKNKIN